jgi:deferrochelatase/peroxidase EfeB
MSAYLNDIADKEAPPLQLDDIQGVILRGYNFEYIRYLIFTIDADNIDGARELIGKLTPGGAGPLRITTAEPWPNGEKPPYCLNIGVTSFGLNMLITPGNYNFVKSRSFPLFSQYDGGAAKNAGSVGDTDDSAPEKWWKRSGGWALPANPKPDGSDLHIQITIYTKGAEERERYYNTLMGMIPSKNNTPALALAFSKDSNPLLTGLNYIHFGYKDSFSQPRLSKVPWNTKKQRMLLGVSTIDDRPIVPPYEFVIQKKYTDNNNALVPNYLAHPFILNGSFAAFRLLYQDVKAFNKFINKTPGVKPELVAAKMCGRWFDGTPLVVSPEGPDPKLKDFDYTNFNYIHATPNQQGDGKDDSFGQLCPYAAHIRRTNPRDDAAVVGNQNNPDGTPNYASNRRIMRRAGAYGPDYEENEPDGVQRGLVGLFICANLQSQFQFIMQSWVTRNSFRTIDASPDSSGFDPLFGPPNKDYSAYNEFAYLPDGSPTQPYKQIEGLERFIRTDGGLYLFLPGIEALKHLSKGTIPPPQPAN